MPPVLYHEGGFPPRNLDTDALMPLIGPATAAIARYDGKLATAPNSSVLLSPLRRREAVLSSRIEGTQSTMEDVMSFEAGKKPESDQERHDNIEIINYIKAMARAERDMKKLPLCQRVICSAHRVLMSGARGKNKSPGQYRKNQNWIGPPGCSKENAKFIPISADKLSSAMSEWEKFIHGENTSDLLIQAAILHAEFEALHPFADGNGRIGRLLIPLFLWQRELIHRPIFYISAYFEARRDQYYERLMAVSRDNDWTGWCRFFLEGVRTQAEEDLEKTNRIFALYERTKSLKVMTRTQYALQTLDCLFQNPILNSSDLTKKSGIPAPTARRILNLLVEENILHIVLPARGRTPGIYIFAELLSIAQD